MSRWGSPASPAALCISSRSRPRAKGGGAAQTLLAAAKDRSPGGLDLLVNQANARAVRFYQREGFAIAGEGCNPASGLPTFAMRWQPPGG